MTGRAGSGSDRGGAGLHGEGQGRAGQGRTGKVGQARSEHRRSGAVGRYRTRRGGSVGTTSGGADNDTIDGQNWPKPLSATLFKIGTRFFVPVKADY